MNALLQNLDQLEEALAPLTGADRYSEVLRQTREHLTRFAGLEKRTLGLVTVPVSPHQLSADRANEASRIEDLARRERERLLRQHPDAADVMDLLDREGIKVYRPPFPPGGELLGFFLFDREVGPALVGDARLDTPTANVLFARLFGHYLLDNDPYRIRLVPAKEDDAEPAARFAAAFLIGVEDLGRYLSALGWTKGKELSGEAVLQLAAYFEVPPATVIGRLTVLGIPCSGTSGTQGPGPSPAAASDPVEPVISGRFVRMALESNARGGLPLEDLARYLETDTMTARDLADRFELPDSEARS